jgi:DNA-binding HxlR family transcriptional regulator
MPEFLFNKKLYYNPVEFAMDRIGGTWKMPILWRLKDKIMRYGELKKDIPHITHKMLTSQLRELEGEGFISREVYPVVPPKVEYSITKRGERAVLVINTIRDYGLELMKEFQVEHSKIAKHRKVK